MTRRVILPPTERQLDEKRQPHPVAGQTESSFTMTSPFSHHTRCTPCLRVTCHTSTPRTQANNERAHH